MRNNTLIKGIFLPFALFIATSLAAQTYMDTSLSAEQRSEDLLSRLTLKEKVSLLEHESKGVSRLNIKPYNWWNEALHGVARAGNATVFPIPMALASTFDENLVYRIFTVVSDEARVKYHQESLKHNGHRQYKGLTFWTPNVNIFRDPRWGRGQETYGEDPYLTSRMGMAVVKGIQGPDTARYAKAFACAKHFAVHSGPEWNRHSFDIEQLSARDLWETYLPAFKSLVTDAKVKQVMCAYNSFEGQPCCSNKKLLIQILRNEWKYKGIIVSDCWAVSDFLPGYHGTHPDIQHAVADAMENSTDLECGNNYRNLEKAVELNLVQTAKIDSSVKRILQERFELGEMDEDSLVSWNKIPANSLCSAEHRNLALEAAESSIVLLQNKNSILPLPKENINIAIVGPNANDSIMQWGNYNGFPKHTTTILQGIKDAAKCNINYIEGCPIIENDDSMSENKIGSYNIQSIIEKTKDADVVIFAGGISPRLEGEEMKTNYPGFKGGDRTNIELPQIQRNILQALKKAGKHIIFLNCSGGAMGLVPETLNCDAILQIWYPGEVGGTAVADILFGKTNPSGHLPVTFYKNIKQLPDFEDYSMKGRTYRYMKDKPLYPFGYGLSYTTYKYNKLRLDKKDINCGDSINVYITIKNKGKRSGTAVAQLYIRREEDKNGPSKSLIAFKRVPLNAHECKEIAFAIKPDSYSCFDEDSNTLHPMKGTYTIECGENSEISNEKKATFIVK
jgi:beta-glucosidase